MTKKLLVISHAFYRISGGDVIAGNLAKYLAIHAFTTTIITNESGRKLFRSLGISPSSIIVKHQFFSHRLAPLLAVPFQTVISLLSTIFSTQKADFIFASSFFLPDLLSAIIHKIHNPGAKLIVGAYLLYPDPTKAGHYHARFKLWLNYFLQHFSLILIKHFADALACASTRDVPTLSKNCSIPVERIIPIRGGVCLEDGVVDLPSRKIYDAVFVGRFHPQKCIPDLLSSWAKVVQVLPAARLALVGDGEQFGMLRQMVDQLKLTKNVSFFGVLTGLDKYRLLKASKIFVSASLYDSGNIALDEALAVGTPGVVVANPHLDYPAGVIQVPAKNHTEYAQTLLDVILDDHIRIRMGKHGKDFIDRFSWDGTAVEFAYFISQFLSISPGYNSVKR